MCTLGHATEIVTDENYIKKEFIRVAGTNKIIPVIEELLSNDVENPNNEVLLPSVTVNAGIQSDTVDKLLG